MNDAKITLIELLREEHSKHQCNRIIQYIGDDEQKFKALMNLFLDGEYDITQRAAWPLGLIAEFKPNWFIPHIAELLVLLTDEHVHEGVPRNNTRIFQFTAVPKRYQGVLMDLCFQYIGSTTTPVAVKANALTILDKLSATYPEIIPELLTVINEQWSHESPAYHARARKILKKHEDKEQ